MAIETLVMSPQPAKQMLDIKPVVSQAIAPAEAISQIPT